MDYDKLQDMFIGTWSALIPLMYSASPHKVDRTTLPAGYSAEFITTPFEDTGRILRLRYSQPDTSAVMTIFEISYNSKDKYFSTITENSIRLAHWKPDFPRYYALYDKDNSKDSKSPYTFMPYPFSEEQYFQLMTVQLVLSEEQYKILDDEVRIMQQLLSNYDALSVGVVLSHDMLEPHEVVNILVPYLKSSMK